MTKCYKRGLFLMSKLMKENWRFFFHDAMEFIMIQWDFLGRRAGSTIKSTCGPWRTCYIWRHQESLRQRRQSDWDDMLCLGLQDGLTVWTSWCHLKSFASLQLKMANLRLLIFISDNSQKTLANSDNIERGIFTVMTVTCLCVCWFVFLGHWVREHGLTSLLPLKQNCQGGIQWDLSTICEENNNNKEFCHTTPNAIVKYSCPLFSGLKTNSFAVLFILWYILFQFILQFLWPIIKVSPKESFKLSIELTLSSYGTVTDPNFLCLLLVIAPFLNNKYAAHKLHYIILVAICELSIIILLWMN